MANIRTCNKHNMIACVEKTAHNADFYQIIDYLTGCSINYSLLVDPDLIGPWLQQFWATASLRVINEVPHIRAMVAGKKILISEDTIRADLLFDDADGVDFHVLLHCLSPKSTSWEQFGTNIASALVGLATNQKFNFSLMIMNGMLGHISNGTPFLMYPRFIQLFLNKQLEGVTRPQNFIPSVTLPSKVFTFMRKHSPKFSCRITPFTPPMLEVITALAAEEAHSESTHSRAESSPRDAQGTPTQSAAQASISILQGTADFQEKRKEAKKKVSSSNWVGDKDEDAVVAITPNLERKSDETEQVIIEEEKDTSDFQFVNSRRRPEDQFKDYELFLLISPQYQETKRLKHPGPIAQKEEINSSNKSVALETAHDEEVFARKVPARMGTEEEERKEQENQIYKEKMPKTLKEEEKLQLQRNNHTKTLN
ncbi:hypothetical protein Tco_0931155 [Tanacetum coccineum]